MRGDRAPSESGAALELPPPGYEIRSVIGRGGMGEVVLARDRRIGRDVALKRMLVAQPTPEESALFLREARIQARLAHPAIVPVFEIDADQDGRPYFTMKWVTGTTLHDRIQDPAASVKAMLGAVVDVCRAIELAHARGVVHRDLKPANVMLGDYGEVYVLDWGIARVLDGTDLPAHEDLVETRGDGDTSDGRGTPGYMAPEQARGEVSPAADVYALGCILAEVVAREPASPELAALCTRARAEAPGERPTARAVADAVQRYLDGDRDTELRRGLAASELEAARTAVAAGDSAIAIRAAGSALALDPASRDAAQLVGKLMIEAPVDDMRAPAGLRAALADADASDVRRHARRAALAYMVSIPLLPIAMWNGIESWAVVGAALAVAGLLSLAAWRIAARPERSAAQLVAYAAGNAIYVGILTRTFGPFTFVPGLACLMIASMCAYPPLARRGWLLVATIVAGWCVPVLLEQLGVLARTFESRPDGLLLRSTALDLTGATTASLLFATCLAMLLLAGYLATSIAVGHLAAKRRLVGQAWQLRQLLPP
nr:serine/threonine-protein kinase [Kofleriaceae bacterium]